MLNTFLAPSFALLANSKVILQTEKNTKRFFFIAVFLEREILAFFFYFIEAKVHFPWFLRCKNASDHADYVTFSTMVVKLAPHATTALPGR